PHEAVHELGCLIGDLLPALEIQSVVGIEGQRAGLRHASDNPERQDGRAQVAVAGNIAGKGAVRWKRLAGISLIELRDYTSHHVVTLTSGLQLLANAERADTQIYAGWVEFKEISLPGKSCQCNQL